MRIVSYRGQHDRGRWHVDAPLDPDRVTLHGEQITLSAITPLGEWRITLTKADVAVLGGRLAELTGGRS